MLLSKYCVLVSLWLQHFMAVSTINVPTDLLSNDSINYRHASWVEQSSNVIQLVSEHNVFGVWEVFSDLPPTDAILQHLSNRLEF